MNRFTRRQGRQAEERDNDPAPKTPALSPLPRQMLGFETVIGSSVTLSGELRCQGDVRIDGTFEGVLEIEGNLLVGESGKIYADVHAKNVSVAGAVRGDIYGKKVQLLKTARVWGDIHAAAITTEEGAFIDGKLTMVQHEASVQSLELPALPTPSRLEVVEGETLNENS